ncbi:MAG: glycerol-phosphate dehydrogenase, partial [Pseudonocardiales bacterium]|nr:glycerol-phosphate dehydrogenase [Pseudonocardiales bacterium]
DEDGATARECWTAYRRKLTWINAPRDRLQRLCDDWGSHDPVAADLLAAPEAIAGTLRAAGAASRFAELEPAPEPGTAGWAVANCHLMRDRFTVVDLAEIAGLWTGEDVADVLHGTQRLLQ